MTKYQVVIKDFADTTTFGPGNNIVVLSDATHIGWSEYINEVSEAFFSLSQEDPTVSLLTSAVNLGKHVLIYRDGVLVWGGWLGEADETLNDVIFTAYSYVSGFYHYLMEWTREWVAIDAHTIIENTFDYAKGLTKSRVGWLTKGTIEPLFISSGGGGTLAMPLYRAPYKRALSVFRELAAYSISDTTNRVKFEVTPAGVFNLFKNSTTALTDVRWSYGNKIRSYQRTRLPVDRRNELMVVGSTPRDTDMRQTVTDTTNRDAAGLKQEPIYLSWVRDTAELDRVAKIRGNKASRIDTNFYVTFFKNTLIPARGTGADYVIGDTIDLSIHRGATSLTPGAGDEKIIAGQQVIFSGGDEFIRVLLSDKL